MSHYNYNSWNKIAHFVIFSSSDGALKKFNPDNFYFKILSMWGLKVMKN